MAMLGGDKRLIEAHNRAVDTAIKQIEAMASTRVMTEGRSETQLTGNLMMELFNHDTSRDQEPQLHTQRRSAARTGQPDGCKLKNTTIFLARSCRTLSEICMI